MGDNKFVSAIPIKTTVAQLVAETLIHRGIHTFHLPKYLLVDKDLAFRGEVIQFFLRVINCQLKRISLFNQKSLRTER